MKDKNKASLLAGEMERQLSTLPDISYFGDDNRDDKREMCSQIIALQLFIAGKPFKNEAVESWIDGDDDDGLEDYLPSKI
jgi:hypothetical protein